MRICQKKTLPPPAGASIAPDDAWDRFIDVVTSPIVLLPSEELHAPAWQLATTLGLTTHDALYLALADMWGTELWTLDAGLASQHHHFKVKDLRNEPFTY